MNKNDSTERLLNSGSLSCFTNGNTNCITTLDELSKVLTLSEEEKSWKEGSLSVPLKITDYYFSLIDKNDPKDPLRHQVVPSSKENSFANLESPDPLMEVKHSTNERLIHRYKSRVAFLATDLCAQYCRHCFRRRFTGTMQGPATRKQVEEASAYIKDHVEVKEMLFTGGDPLTLSLEEIKFMITSFRKARPDLLIRICTRIPVVQPNLITDELVDFLASQKTAPFYLLLQFNHPKELTDEAVKSVAKFVDRGIPAFNQTVLLKGVNDNADTLEELCNKLLFNRIKPYYLFQGDLVSGTECFRVPIKDGLAIEKELRERLSGLAMPIYTSDLPEGGGKIPLHENYIVGCKDGVWEFKTNNGQSRFYPDPQ